MLQCSSHSSLFIATTFVKMERGGQMGRAPCSGVPVTGDVTEAVVVIHRRCQSVSGPASYVK